MPSSAINVGATSAGPTYSSDDAYHITPLIERSWWNRLDVGPFAAAYIALIAMDLSEFESTLPAWFITALFAVALLVHLTLALATQWSTAIRSRVSHVQTPGMIQPKQCTHALVRMRHADSNQRASGIVPLHLTSDTTSVVATLFFHNRNFRCCLEGRDPNLQLWQSVTDIHSLNPENSLRFRSLYYPIDLPLQVYAEWQGHASVDAVTTGSRVYGPNVTVLKLPAFLDLLGEQVVAPFFLFQIFCVLLWSLDEYWYYALFTLFALLAFESTVAYNRRNGLRRLHHAGHKGEHRVWIRRGVLSGAMQWMRIATRELVPGDVVSLTSASTIDDGESLVPADIFILHGSAVADEALLTGESVPQLKSSVQIINENIIGKHCRLDLNDAQFKEGVLFSGSKLLAATASSDLKWAPPDSGVVGIVLRTGFDTTQGNLLRTMAHASTGTGGVHTWDTFVFITLLILCAFAAAALVLNDGWSDERRNKFRLVLHVIIIVTSVVPPELPMELSLAVTNSVAALMHRSNVYCTEPFRIPWAGQIDTCCFDKTGTLTSDQMQLRGLRVFREGETQLTDDEDKLLTEASGEAIPWTLIRIMASCHSLSQNSTNGASRLNPIGDPMEQEVLRHSRFTLSGPGLVIPHEHDAHSEAVPLRILHRYAFSSKLKRMTVLVSESSGKNLALTKGAPETIKGLLGPASCPPHFDSVVNYHMNRGRRVLATAYKEYKSIAMLQKEREKGRDAVENNLTLAGLLVLDCPLKSDSKTVIAELRRSRHRVAMITGDALLTAVEVARQVSIIPKAAQVFEIRAMAAEATSATNARFGYHLLSPHDKNADTRKDCVLSPSDLPNVMNRLNQGEIAFCVSGSELVHIATQQIRCRDSSGASDDDTIFMLHENARAALSGIVPLVSVFARHTPYLKEVVINAMKSARNQTLMCGDGTNDVGALKRAHVGISILSVPSVESKQRKASKTMSRLAAEQKRSTKAKAARKQSAMAAAWQSSLQELQRAQEELDFVEPGDASVAAPFTARSVSIVCCKHVIQQGRCTLVTMLQIYKILGVNCLVNAMVLSKLFLHGVKQGDRQLTFLGILVAALFYFVTRSEPLQTLAPEQPPSSVLCQQALISIALQFAVHAVAILLTAYAALHFVDPYDPSIVPDGPFNPNVLNTCTFLLTFVSTINTFAVNFRGRPFMQDLRENRWLWRSLVASYLVAASCALEMFSPLNGLLQLSTYPEIQGPTVDNGFALDHYVKSMGFAVFIFSVMMADTALVFAIEWILRRIFP